MTKSADIDSTRLPGGAGEVLNVTSERPKFWCTALLYSPALAIGGFMFSEFISDFKRLLASEDALLAAVAALASSIYLILNYFGGCFRAQMSWDDGVISYRKGSPKFLYWPQTGFSGSYNLSETKHIYATFLSVMLVAEKPGVMIPLPVGWKSMGKWFPAAVEACLKNEGQMNYKVAKELESGRRLPPQPELAARVREYLDGEGPLGGRVSRD